MDAKNELEKGNKSYLKINIMHKDPKVNRSAFAFFYILF